MVRREIVIEPETILAVVDLDDGTRRIEITSRNCAFMQAAVLTPEQWEELTNG